MIHATRRRRIRARNKERGQGPRAMLQIGIDVGTQGTKCVVIDEDANVLARGACSYGLIPSQVEGRAEQHPSTWIEVSGQQLGA